MSPVSPITTPQSPVGEPRHHAREEMEFNYLGRILGGVGAKVPITSGRLGSGARARFEAHIALHYDRPGCFAYVGWSAVPKCPANVQWLVYGAFARAAVAAHIHLGGLEPAEGFGLACWLEPVPKPMHKAYDDAFGAMKSTIGYALHILGKEGTEGVASGTRIAVGCGRLRGSWLFGPQSGRVLLDGPRAVETVYGDIPNRCGGMAKSKDPVAKKLFKDRNEHIGLVSLYRQKWAYFNLQGGEPQTAVWSGAPVPADQIEQITILPEKIPTGAPQPFLVGLSLDFAKSSVEYGLDAHRARAVVNRILSSLEEMAGPQTGVYVSPRYGDGLAAVVAVEAPDANAVLRAPWVAQFNTFVNAAKDQLAPCQQLGLRIGLAIEQDLEACTPRLAGLSRVSSPAVEPIAQSVIDKARSCHVLSKERKPDVLVSRTVQVFQLVEGVPLDVTVLSFGE